MTRPRCLFLAPRPPWPPTDGGAIRSFNVLRRLATRFDVDVACFIPPWYSVENLPELDAHARLVRTVPLPGSVVHRAPAAVAGMLRGAPANMQQYALRRMRDLLEELAAAHPYDVVHFNHMHVAHYAPLFPRALRVVDTHNNDIHILRRWAERQGNPLKRAFGLHQARLARAYLARRMPAMDLVLTVSEKEAGELRGFAPQSEFLVVPNGVETAHFRAHSGDRPPDTLLFTGDMSWLPNDDASRFFIEQCLPVIRRSRPDARLVMAGRNPSEWLKAQASDRIEVTGFVDDMRPYYDHATVFIVPLRIGGGTRLKILEAMAMGIPVVSTSIGCEGLDVQDGTHLVVADEPEAFARAVLQLLEDAERRAQLAAQARAHVEAVYDWQPLIDKYLARLDELLRAR